MTTQKHIAVLMGGESLEHDISLKSGSGVAAALDREAYTVTPVVISRAGRWSFDGGPEVGFAEAGARLAGVGVDAVFLALHGTCGEDGRIQGFLDLLRLPYTGSGCAASALAMDKIRCKTVVEAQGIRVAGHLALNRPTWAVSAGEVREAVAEDLGYPCVVKPSRQGSSFGVTIVRDAAGLDAAMTAAFEADEEVMVEQYVAGREVTCAVLDTDPGGRLQSLPVTEIRPKSGAFFDFEAKYTAGACDEITPADLPPETADAVAEMAAHAHEIVGCAGWSRSDFIVGPEGPVWIEINTIPGLTPTSLFPQAAAAVGISYGQLAGLLIEDALRRAARMGATH